MECMANYTEEAVSFLMNNRDIQMDALTRYIR